MDPDPDPIPAESDLSHAFVFSSWNADLLVALGENQIDQAIVHRLQELQERTKQSANSKYGDAVHTFAPTVPPPSLMHKDPPKSSGGMFSFFKSSSSKSSHGTNILKAQAERQEKENQKLREKTGYSEKEEKQRQAISHAQFKAFGSEMKDVVAKKQEITSGNQRLASALKAVNGQGVASPAVFINGKPQPPPGMPARISNGTPTQTQPVPTTTPTPISNGTEPASTPITTVATTTSPTTPAPTATATGAPITIVATPTPADVKPTSAEPEVAKASTPTSVSASVATEPAAVSAPAPTPAPAPAAIEPAATATATATSTPTVNTAAATTSPASASPTSASTSTSPSASSSKPPLPPTPAPSLPPSQQNMSDKKSATPIRRSSQSPAGSSPIPSSSQISPITSQPTSPIVTIPPISTNGSHNGISRTSTPSPSLTPAIDDETDVADDGDPESVSGEWEEKEVTAEIEQELETQRERVKTILLTQDDDDDDEEDEYEMDPYSGPIYAQPLQRIIRIRRITRKKRTSIFPLSPSFFAIPTSPTSTSLPPLTIPPAMSSQSSSSPTSIDEKPSIVSVPIGTVGANKPAMPSYASLGPHDDAINTATHHAINQIHTHIINAIQQQYIRIIPLPLIALSSYILKHGMNVEGIFRIPGDSGEVQQLKSVCDTVASNMAMWPELDKHLKLENYSVHSVAGAFKLFFRQLPEPLLTYELYTPLLHAYEKGDPDGLVALVYHQLKQPNLVVLRYLLTVLTLVSMGEKFNKMSATNLAIVFAPNILRPKMETQQSIMMDTKKCIGVLTMILDDHADANNILSPVAVHMNAMLTAQASSPSSISSPRASTKPTASSPVGAKPYQPSSISSTASSIRAISPSSPSTSPTNTSPSSTSPTAGAKPYQPSSISSTSSSLTRPGVKLPPNAGGQVPIGKAAAAVSIKK